VTFFAAPTAATRAGFRACKRCKPDDDARDLRAERVAMMCRALDRADRPVPLEVLARTVSLSPFHAHRLFKEVTGLTPRAYAIASREERVRRTLGTATSITDAIYAAGYGGPARFYSRARSTLGMPAATYRAGGAHETITYAIGACSLGSLLVATTPKGVCALFLGDDPRALVRDLEDRFRRADCVRGDEALADVVRRAAAMVDDPRARFALPLDVRGTVFQARVWAALRALAPGETITYAALAKKLGRSKGARAVAAACARNPIAVVIPCHRVLRGDGALAGYRWGIARQRALLARESKGPTG